MKALKAIIICALVVAVSAAAAAQSANDESQILHVLERLGFGPRPGDVERVRAMGLDKYIALQLEPARIDDTAVAQRLAQFETLGLGSREMASRYFTPPQQNRQRPQPPQMTPPPDEPGRMPAAPEAQRAARAQANLPLIELSQQKLLRAVYSERQLEEVLVDFWFNHFNVFAGKGQFARFYLTEYEREAIRPHVLG
ncbi:MAG TPA: DUF1800 family protein, partial [Vicinamibacterales bacterium]